MRKIRNLLLVIKNISNLRLRKRILQEFADFIVIQVEHSIDHEQKLYWFGIGLTLDTYCIVAFKMYLE